MLNSDRLALLLVLIGAGSRLLHLPPNIAAVTGVTVFAGYAIRNRWVAVLVPVAAMALADVVLGLYPSIAMTWLGIAAGVFIARGLLRPLNPARLAAATFLASLAFFILSNFGTWLEGWYGYTLGGLGAAYVAALPFWQNSLLADFVTTAIIFGLYWLAKRAVPSMEVKA